MKIIHVFLIFLMMFSISLSFSQDLTGAWMGFWGHGNDYKESVGKEYHFTKDCFYVYLELYQNERNITGIIYFANRSTPKMPIGEYVISGKLDKKNPLAHITLVRDGIVNPGDEIHQQFVKQFFRKIALAYSVDGKWELLSGDWYSNMTPGVLWVEKKSTVVCKYLADIMEKDYKKKMKEEAAKAKKVKSKTIKE